MTKPESTSLNLTYAEIKDLPEDLVKELTILDSHKEEYRIKNIIKNAGGMLNIDRIIIAIYHETSKIVKRSTLNSRLYHMVKKGLISSVPGKRGIYFIDPKEQK